MLMNEDRLILVYTTFASLEQAREMGNILVRERLAACVNIFPGMISIYEWQEALEECPETAMIIKTRSTRLDAAMSRARELHPYETPALLVLPVDSVNSDYMHWITQQTSNSGN